MTPRTASGIRELSEYLNRSHSAGARLSGDGDHNQGTSARGPKPPKYPPKFVGAVTKSGKEAGKSRVPSTDRDRPAQRQRTDSPREQDERAQSSHGSHGYQHIWLKRKSRRW